MDDTGDDERMQRDEDTRSAIAIIRMMDELERAHPQRTRHIESQLLWVLARRAGHAGYGGELLGVARGGVRRGEDDRREDEAREAAAADPTTPRPTTACVGHA